MTDRKQLEESIRALESQRATLGDAVVDSSLTILREKLAEINRSVVTQTQQAGERKLVTVMLQTSQVSPPCPKEAIQSKYDFW